MTQATAKIAFVGCGTHSTNNLYPMLKYTRARLDAVCDLDRGLAERNARVFGAASVYTDAARMLAERRPEGVFVVGPPELHYEVAKEALIVVDNVDRMEIHLETHSGTDLNNDLNAISPDVHLDGIRVWRPDQGIPNMQQTRHFIQGFAGEVREFIDAIIRHPNQTVDLGAVLPSQ